METNERPTQASRVLAYMKKHKYITQREALNELGVWRLASRISELQHKHGIAVKSEFITVTNRWDEKCQVKRYWLAEEQAVL